MDIEIVLKSCGVVTRDIRHGFVAAEVLAEFEVSPAFSDKLMAYRNLSFSCLIRDDRWLLITVLSILQHWYHHVATLNYGLMSYVDNTAFNTWIVWLNFSVHAVMYTYYFLAACRIRLPNFPKPPNVIGKQFGRCIEKTKSAKIAQPNLIFGMETSRRAPQERRLGNAGGDVGGWDHPIDSS
ncbi:hypothetical protein GPALN_004982 [Globodera pallida]|nr:hypothetical protein GPALN_004982 [Globodera pallida]